MVICVLTLPCRTVATIFRFPFFGRAEPSDEDPFLLRSEDRCEHDASASTPEEPQAPTRHLEVKVHSLVDGRAEWQPVAVNSESSMWFETELFSGRILFLNNSTAETTPARSSPYAHHFFGKHRKFEVRVQGRFKTDPGSLLFISGQLPQRLGLSWTLRLTIRWLLGVARTITAARGFGFTYNMEETETEDGGVARPYFVVPLCAANCITRTPEGQTPPDLTGSLVENTLAERIKLTQDLNTTDTFTFAFWDMYFDFDAWRMVNLPFGWPADLSSLLGDQPIQITAYSLPSSAFDASEDALSAVNSSTLHVESDKQYLMRLELCSAEISNSRELSEVEIVDDIKEDSRTNNADVLASHLAVEPASAGSKAAPRGTPACMSGCWSAFRPTSDARTFK